MMQRRKVTWDEGLHHRQVIASQVLRPYLIYSYPYSHASAGPKVLHRLCHELNAAGQRAYVSFPETNPAWNTPYRAPSIDPSWVAIYPEVVSGNPWGASTVARWVLNTPGKLGGDKEYDPAEIVFTYARIFHDTAPLLELPAVETDIYFDRGLPRQGAAIYGGKRGVWRAMPGTEITLEMRQEPERLAEFLNSVEVLYCFDMVSGMIDVARLAGCPVVIIPDGTLDRQQWDSAAGWNGIGWDEMPKHWDPVAFRAEYMMRVAAFGPQLREFVRQTQVPVAVTA